MFNEHTSMKKEERKVETEEKEDTGGDVVDQRSQSGAIPPLPTPQPQDIQQYVDIFGCHNRGDEAKDAKHTTIHRKAPPPTTENYMAQNVNSAKAEKPEVQMKEEKEAKRREVGITAAPGVLSPAESLSLPSLEAAPGGRGGLKNASGAWGLHH